MNPFEFVIAIIALSFLYKLGQTLIRARTARHGDDTAGAELLRRLEQMERRVRVLERIVTDDRSDLKQQFRDLES